MKILVTDRVIIVDQVLQGLAAYREVGSDPAPKQLPSYYRVLPWGASQKKVHQALEGVKSDRQRDLDRLHEYYRRRGLAREVWLPESLRTIDEIITKISDRLYPVTPKVEVSKRGAAAAAGIGSLGFRRRRSLLM